ncbi:thermonuclease family protein [Streptomyces sp. NPDC005408]|uniref:thermonuclease family protein n=1 Tax=Streptomyces sp. NPDC005408 TaxID=3155341 RepID=UPI0033A38F5C
MLVALLGLGVLGALLGEEDGPAPKSPPVVGKTTQPPSEAPAGTPSAAVQKPSKTTPPSATGQPKKARPKAPLRAVVLRVIDGDTIQVQGDGRIIPAGTPARVRLLEIDTPEKGACFGRDATTRTAKLLAPGQRLRVERDVQLKDRYGRYLLYVWNEQGVFVNKSLVESGHAKSVLYQPNDKYWAEISQAGDRARQARKGLWSACHTTPRTTPPPADSDLDRPPGLPAGPPAGIPDVDCSDLPGPVWVGRTDPHRLDRDGDGIGCDAS